MNHTAWIWADGSLQPWNEVVVPVVTHALHYGTSVFEGVRVYPTANGAAVFRLQDHLKRLLYSARSLNITVPHSLTELSQAVVELLQANQLISGYIRPIIIYGEEEMGLLTTAATPIHVYLICWPWPALLGNKPLRVTVSNWRRIPPSSCDPAAKIGGLYVTASMASRAAYQVGYDEALMLDQTGYIAEGPGENIFFVKQNQLYTPAVGSLLPGITRDTILTLAADSGLTTHQVQWRTDQLDGVDEAFFTGTAAEVAPVAQIDETKFTHSFGPVTKQLRQQYLDVVHGKDLTYQQWLTSFNI